MARRLISTSRSEIRAMSAAELKESIRDSEGRGVLCQNYVGLHPLVDGSTNAELVNTYTTMGVDGIVPFPDMTAGVGPYKEAYEAGIAIGLVNGILPDADFTTAYYGYTQDVLGSGNVECAVKFINEQLGGKPVIINALGFSVGSFGGPRWTEFQRGLAEAFGEEAATPAATIDNGAQADEMMTRIGDALNANPEANIVFCGYEASCQGAIAAIENAEL